MKLRHTLTALLTALTGAYALTTATPIAPNKQTPQAIGIERTITASTQTSQKPTTPNAPLEDTILTVLSEHVPAKITHYCNCIECCDKTEDDPAYGITASGRRAANGMIAAPREIPFGSTITINGKKYTVEDRGGAIMKDDGLHRFDIWCETHDEALERGVIKTDVIITYPTKR